MQVRRVRLHVRLRVEEAAPLQELRPLGLLRLCGDLLAEEHAAADLQRRHVSALEGTNTLLLYHCFRVARRLARR